MITIINFSRNADGKWILHFMQKVEEYRIDGLPKPTEQRGKGFRSLFGRKRRHQRISVMLDITSHSLTWIAVSGISQLYRSMAMCHYQRKFLYQLKILTGQSDIGNRRSSPSAWPSPILHISISPSHPWIISFHFTDWNLPINLKRGSSVSAGQRREKKMFGCPTNSIENTMTPCFFNVRQVLPTNLSTQAVLQLPPKHGGIQFIEAIQPIPHHLLEVCTHITNFINAGNNQSDMDSRR